LVLRRRRRGAEPVRSEGSLVIAVMLASSNTGAYRGEPLINPERMGDRLRVIPDRGGLRRVRTCRDGTGWGAPNQDGARGRPATAPGTQPERPGHRRRGRRDRAPP